MKMNMLSGLPANGRLRMIVENDIIVGSSTVRLKEQNKNHIIVIWLVGSGKGLNNKYRNGELEISTQHCRSLCVNAR